MSLRTDSTIRSHNYVLLSFADLPPPDLSSIDIVAVGDDCGNDYRGQPIADRRSITKLLKRTTRREHSRRRANVSGGQVSVLSNTVIESTDRSGTRSIVKLIVIYHHLFMPN